MTLCKICKIVFITFLCSLLILSSCFVSSAAVVPSASFYLHQINSILPDNSAVGYVGEHQGVKAVRVSLYNSPPQIAFFYTLPQSLVAGQSYIIKFQVYRSNGSNAYFSANIGKFDSSGEIDGSSALQFYHTLLAEVSKPMTWTDIQCSFVFDPLNPVLFFSLQSTSNTPGTQGCQLYFSQFNLFQFNPNEKLENSVNEQNSKLDEQNSLLDEQNSQIAEGNSIAQDTKDFLENGSEEYSFPDVDIVENHSLVDDYIGELGDNIDNFNNNSHMLNGLHVFSFLFTSFFEGVESDDISSWVSGLIYFSLGLAVLIAILSSFSIRLGSSKHDKGGKK